MVIKSEYVGLAEVAEAVGQAKNTVSNWFSRDEKAPKPYIKNAASPLWKSIEVAEYLKDRGYNILVLPNTQGKTGKIVIMGRARLGKSFFISILCENGKLYAKVFCSGGSTKTACPVHNMFVDAEFNEFFEFHSDFNTIYEAEGDNEELKQLKNEISHYVDEKKTFTDSDESEDIEITIKKIEDLVRRIKSFEKKYPGRKDSNTYLEVYLHPNAYLRNVMRECQLRRLEVVDTPGVSGSVDATKLSKANMYIIALKPDDTEEAQTLKRIVEEVRPYAANAEVVFMYKKEAVITSKKKYEEKTEEARKDMKEFEDIFASLKGAIINTTAEILNPSKNTVMFPTMDEDIPLAQELFLETMKDRMINAFNTEKAEEKAKNDFKNVLSEQGDKAKKFVIKLLEEIPIHELSEGKEEYTQSKFRSEKHERVMTNDGYRLRNNLHRAYAREVKLLDTYFSKYDDNNTPEEWKQTIIRYVYRIISKSVSTDRGIGVGTHPWEETPARTMLVEESVNADTVYEYVEGTDNGKMPIPYRKALRDSQINASDRSWMYVGTSDEEAGLKKLKLVIDSLINIKVYNRDDMVLTRYVGGLRKIAEYNIVQDIGYDESSSMEIVKKLPF